jgi:glucose/arabinose dehydrogenase
LDKFRIPNLAFMKIYATLFWSIGLYAISVVSWSQTPQLRLQTFVTGLTKPVDIVNAGTNRLFVAEMGGKIKIVESTGTVLSTPFLQIPASHLIDVEYSGIYGIAFHPNFASNGYFYVFYNQKDGQGVLSRFKPERQQSECSGFVERTGSHDFSISG